MFSTKNQPVRCILVKTKLKLLTRTLWYYKESFTLDKGMNN